MKGQQSGFTLVELIAVIVVLAIMAVVALPRFVDVTDGAEQAATDGVAGNIASAMALNYSAAVAENAGLTPASPHVAVDNCDDSGALLLGGLPSGYSVAANAAVGLGTVAACVLTGAGGKTRGFSAIGAP